MIFLFLHKNSIANGLMNYQSEDRRDVLQDNLPTVMAVGIILLLLLGLLVFFIRVVLPNWQARAEFAAQFETLQSAHDAQAQSGAGLLSEQIVTAEAQFGQVANQFLTEAQAAAFLDGLYASAEAVGVAIVDLQAEPRLLIRSENGEKPAYDIRQFRLLVAGDKPQLDAFVGSLEEAAVPSVSLQNLTIADNELTADLLLYTSPFSTGEPIVVQPIESTATPLAPVETAVPPTPTPTAVPDVSSLIDQLDDPWAAEDWPQVITLIQQIRQQAPNTPEMIEKLYAARVNYGYQLAGLGETAAAVEQFEQALAIVPDGEEAEAGLQALFAPAATATPDVIVYIVQRGDTLYSIARRYGSMVDEVKAANGLTNNNISPGQQLIIP
ncbi:hypothetical protein MNBD_CHLOROFLEXI01-1637 [hydrothermal vent metagenome]|uniref:LysM domain-containing protein n=1 Tax=hydrothermal vent metagenome TaxID=652676 RepID=A0A3B0USQ6_9ZZZZ